MDAGVVFMFSGARIWWNVPEIPYFHHLCRENVTLCAVNLMEMTEKNIYSHMQMNSMNHLGKKRFLLPTFTSWPPSLNPLTTAPIKIVHQWTMTFDSLIRGQVILVETQPPQKIKCKSRRIKFGVDLDRAKLLGKIPINQMQRCW